MESEFLSGYIGQMVKLTLSNGYFYRARILSVSKEQVVFIEEKGRRLCVTPKMILILEEVRNG
jgi:hypothetical protein